MSGLTAASRLQEFGFTSVMVLEARTRVGGRVFTRVVPDTKWAVELGASTLWGTDSNKLSDRINWRGAVW